MNRVLKEFLDENGLTPERVYKAGLYVALDLCEEEFQISELQKDSCLIRFITNPNDTLQLVAVEKGETIQFIKSRGEKLKLAAVQNNWAAIQFIKNPSEEIQFAAIQKTAPRYR